MSAGRAAGVPACAPGAHGATGSFDEAARRLSHAEHAVARLLEAEGHRVAALAEGGGPRADLDVCGVAVEVKSWLPAARRGGRAPSARSVCNKLLDAGRQGSAAVLWAAGSGLPEAEARRGVALYAALGRPGALRSLRVVGDGYDLSWRVGPDLARAASARGGPALGRGG